MISKEVKFKDFSGEEITKKCYFHLTKLELTRLDVKFEGGLAEYAKNLGEAKSPQQLLSLIEDVILTAYGIKTAEGKFIKNAELRKEFEYSECYSELVLSLFQDENAMSEFIAGLAYMDEDDKSEVIEAGKNKKKK